MSPTSRACVLAALLALSCIAAAQERWTLQTVLLPPAEAGYAPHDVIGFGAVVEMSDDWLAIVANSADCSFPAGSTSASIFLYRFDRATDSHIYSQRVCTSYVASLALSGDWMMIGSPHHDDTPGDNLQNGKVSFVKFDKASGTWSQVQSATGAIDSLMGYSVAMRDGVAVAGESGYDGHRGRVRSWRLNAARTEWISEGWLYPGASPNIRVHADEGFGAYVALDIRGCRAPTCIDPLDMLVIQSRSGIHGVERRTNGWGARNLTRPARGTTTSFSELAINGNIVVASALIAAGAADAPCINAGTSYVSTVRALTRVPGSIALRHIDFACVDEIGATPSRNTVRRLDVAEKGGEFFASIPDYPAQMIGTASTWTVTSPSNVAISDAVVDLDYTPIYDAASNGSSLYFPAITGDAFGLGMATRANWLVVGAPFYNALPGILGAGYVAIYRR